MIIYIKNGAIIRGNEHDNLDCQRTVIYRSNIIGFNGDKRLLLAEQKIGYKQAVSPVACLWCTCTFC